MAEPEIALVFTPESWVEDLHRFFTDHGGARVRQIVVDPALARDEEYSILVVSWRWPALTPGLVAELHDRRRRVLGVFDREEVGSRDLLIAVGVDRMVESDAPPSAFLEALIVLQPDQLADEMFDTPALAAPARDDETGRRSRAWLVVGGPAGAGTTELAIGIASTHRRNVLVDADEIAPSVAARLALPIEPNLRTAIDAVEFGLGDLEQSIQTDARLGFNVVAGLPNVAAWSQVRAPEVLRVVAALATRARLCVVDTSALLDDVGGPARGRFAVTRAVVAEADMLIAVGQATPLGVVRLLSWIADAAAIRPGVALHVVLNRAPRDPFRCAELIDEVRRTYVPESLHTVPTDRRVETAAWAGVPVRKGPFRNAVDELTARVVEGQMLGVAAST